MKLGAELSPSPGEADCRVEWYGVGISVVRMLWRHAVVINIFSVGDSHCFRCREGALIEPRAVDDATVRDA